MRAIFGAAVMLAVLGACSPAAPAGPTAAEIAKNSEDLIAFLDAKFEEELQLSPESMTAQGRKDRYGELDDRSEKAADEELAWRKQSVADMKAKFKPETLSEDTRLSYEVWDLELTRDEKANQFRRHSYIFGRNGAHTGLVNFLINEHRVDDKADLEAYISRVGAIGTALDQLIEQATLNAEAGNRMPGFAYDQTASEIARVTSGAPFKAPVDPMKTLKDKVKPGTDSALFTDGKEKIKALAEAGKLKPEEAVALTEQLRLAMVEKMQPAYERLAAWIVKDKPNASPEAKGVGAQPDGVAYYNARLYLSTTTDMTADEIHELGLKEVARIRGEMEDDQGQGRLQGLAGRLLRVHAHGQAVLPAEHGCWRGAVSHAGARLSRCDGEEAAGVFRQAAEGEAAGEACRGFPGRAGRRAAL